MLAQPAVQTKNEIEKPHIENVSLKEVKIVIFGLKNWKVPGIDNILAELKIWR